MFFEGRYDLGVSIRSAFILALAAARGVSSIAPKYLIAISAGSVAAIATSALAMALVAAFVPARFLARLDPASAFRR